MTHLLYWAPVAVSLFDQTQPLLQSRWVDWYLAIFALKEDQQDHPSMVYVAKKIAYAEKLWLTTLVYKNYTNKDSVLSDIDNCNNDIRCLWIIVQLPLPKDLQPYQMEILNAVTPEKDVDCLGDNSLLLAATPRAMIAVLQHYGYDTFVDKSIAVLGESRLIWHPLANHLRDVWARVYTFNEFSDQQNMREVCRESDYIMACTWSLHLVDDSFLSTTKQQIIVDAWWGMLDWKPAWDVYTEKVIWKVFALTPVPWGVWPVTVASLFRNLAHLPTSLK